MNIIIKYDHMLKDFNNWFKLKSTIHFNNVKPPLVREGQLWWSFIGENIGTEINGKSTKFSRPAIIYQKLSHYTYLVIPVSTKIKTGSWYSVLSFKSNKMVACLNQIRVVDYRRLDDLMGELSVKDFSNVKQSFIDLYAKNMPPMKGGRGESQI
jgi:hypothetical protein